MTRYLIALAATLALAGCQTANNSAPGASQTESDPSAPYGTGLDTTYGESSPPRFFPDAQPSAGGTPSVPGRSAEMSETWTGTAAGRPLPQGAPAQSEIPQRPTLSPATDTEMAPDRESDSVRAIDSEPETNTNGDAGLSSGISAADQAITRSVTNAFGAAGIAQETLSRVNVRTVNGRVILSGEVNGQEEKQRLEAEAKNTPGVRTVISQLIIASPDSSTSNSSGVGSPGSSSEGAGSESRIGSPTPVPR